MGRKILRGGRPQRRIASADCCLLSLKMDEKKEISLTEFRDHWKKEIENDHGQKEGTSSENVAALLFQQGVELERKF